VGGPPGGSAREKAHCYPEGHTATADPRNGDRARVRLTRRAGERDPQLEVTGTRPGAGDAGNEVTRERRTLGKGELTIQLSLDLTDPVFMSTH
jgi:hypothetical protein